MRTLVYWICLGLALHFATGCASAEVDKSDESDSGSDTDDTEDTGSDSDTDADTDSDTDSDADTDTDTDTDTDQDTDLETCNNLDDDLDGDTDEDIYAGEDVYEPNQSCVVPNSLGIIAEEDNEESWMANIYPSGDSDFFRVYLEEYSHSCVPFTSQDFYVQVTLTPPQGADCVNYDLYAYNDSCAVVDQSTETGCDEEVIEYHWEGVCTIDDSIYMRFEVRPIAGASECAEYTLSFDMWSN